MSTQPQTKFSSEWDIKSPNDAVTTRNLLLAFIESGNHQREVQLNLAVILTIRQLRNKINQTHDSVYKLRSVGAEAAEVIELDGRLEDLRQKLVDAVAAFKGHDEKVEYQELNFALKVRKQITEESKLELRNAIHDSRICLVQGVEEVAALRRIGMQCDLIAIDEGNVIGAALATSLGRKVLTAEGKKQRTNQNRVIANVYSLLQQHHKDHFGELNLLELRAKVYTILMGINQDGFPNFRKSIEEIKSQVIEVNRKSRESMARFGVPDVNNIGGEHRIAIAAQVGNAEKARMYLSLMVGVDGVLTHLNTTTAIPNFIGLSRKLHWIDEEKIKLEGMFEDIGEERFAKRLANLQKRWTKTWGEVVAATSKYSNFDFNSIESVDKGVITIDIKTNEGIREHFENSLRNEIEFSIPRLHMVLPPSSI
ncbi:hypothetical protein CCACVL1_19909 [Corchorus capsularis]|uniref:Uncharacterized protein n=1 Tax=Corchorus capsularis TaxID=210143 RepID=A0A1R3HDY8_COCAP|nr:hypothetical protein CCACVL1_19909 [Corchorus capsularis]